MRFLHVSATLSNSPGVRQQVQWEQEAADRLGLDWTSLAYPIGQPGGKGPTVGETKQLRNRSVVGWLKLRIGAALFIYRQMKHFDCVLTRYSPHDPFQLLLLLVARQRKIVLVHHTIEEDELRLDKSPIGVARLQLERILGPLAIRHSAGTVAVTPEIAEYEVTRAHCQQRRYVVYPNGISSAVEPCPDERGNRPELLFVASYFDAWHGLDLLLASAKESDDDFLLHLVGEVPKDLQELAKGDERIQQHGMIEQMEIRRLTSRSWLGVSSLAPWRKGLTQCCPLKVREYLALGLPVVGAHRETIDSHFPFFREIEPSIDLNRPGIRGGSVP